MEKKKKKNSKRLDQYLVDKKIISTRSRAQALILAGKVYVNNQKIVKSGFQIKGDEPQIEVRDNSNSFVSRGGLKLEKAIKNFELDLKDLICIDVGVSTGGFTHCMLKYGAKHIVGVDVGYGQVDLKIKNNPKVTIMERTNFRNSKPEDFEFEFDFFSMDVSFISTDKLFAPLESVLKEGAEGVVLLKPQFEAGKSEVGKGGIVRDPEIHKSIIDKFIDSCYNHNLSLKGIIFSPIQGRGGNIEYLALLKKSSEVRRIEDFNISEFVDNTFNFFRSSNDGKKENSNL